MKKTNIKNKNTENDKVAIAKLRHLRIATRKVRLVANMIRNMHVNEAEAQLMIMSKRSALAIHKLLKSAIAGAKEKKMDESRLFIAEIFVDEGPTLKRWLPRAMGRATPINKRTSHITMLLKESEKSVQSRFVTTSSKKKKDKISKSSTGTKIDKKKEDKEQQKQQSNISTINEKNKAEDRREVKKTKTGAKKTLAKKLFRRKSI